MPRDTEIEDLAEFVAEEYSEADQIEPTEIAKNCGMTFSFGRYANCFDGYWSVGRVSFTSISIWTRVGQRILRAQGSVLPMN